MGWDPAVLRKYNTTGHFRLLNQLRSELQAQPMPRLSASSEEAAASGRRGRRGMRTVEVRPLAYGRGRRGGAASSTHPAQPAPHGQAPSEAVGFTAIRPPSPAAEAQSGSFRDRLNAIEMR
jgi:hypothetical protein